MAGGRVARSGYSPGKYAISVQFWKLFRAGLIGVVEECELMKHQDLVAVWLGFRLPVFKSDALS